MKENDDLSQKRGKKLKLYFIGGIDMANKKKIPEMDGCIDPFSLAEEIEEKHIDWSKCEDQIETLSECLGITKEGFLSDENPLMTPYISNDDNGKPILLDKEQAAERASKFLKKHRRVESKSTKRPRSLKAANDDASQAQSLDDDKIDTRQKRILDVLYGTSSESAKPEKKLRANNKKGDSSSSNEDGGLVEAALLANYKWVDKGYYFNEAPLWSDVVQNNIGDCYFLAALCSIAFTNAFKIQNLAGWRASLDEQRYSHAYPESPWHKFEFYVPSSGYESSSIWKGKTKTKQAVYVSEEVLVNKTSGRNYGASGPKEQQGLISSSTSKANMDSCWPAVYEKAYAAFLNKDNSNQPYMLNATASKAVINGGNGGGALKELLGTERISNTDLSSITVSQLKTIASNGFWQPTTAAIHQYSKKENGKDVYYSKAGTKSYYFSLGLYTGHVYSVLGTYTIGNDTYVIVRNPHGRNPAEMKNNPKVYHKSWRCNNGYGSFTYKPEVSYSDNLVLRDVSGNDDTEKSNGAFLIEINEFKRLFEHIYYPY